VVEDGDFYKGKPLWVLANENQMVSASMFWVGSEAPIQDVFPTYYYKYTGKVSYDQRVNQTIKWLEMPERTRPHFITLYFSITDDVGHKYGPNSPEMAKAVKSIDQTIAKLMEQTKKLDFEVNVIVVSDHGMIEVDRDNIIYKENIIPKGVIVSKSFPMMVYSPNKSLIDSMYSSLTKDTTRFDTYLKANMPTRFHYSKEDERVGDLLVMPKPPFTFGSKTRPIKKGASTHGYDPKRCPEMGAIFFADGPMFINNSMIDTCENVDIYPLISHILNIENMDDAIDGDLNVFSPILIKQ
jgi:predicted AlkP superfamily pyrophosphatase or phosphodiesterase